MIYADQFDDPSAELIVRLLESGQTISTRVTRQPKHPDHQAVGCVRFVPMDRYCGDCGDELREYGEKADFTTVAAQIKCKYGRTLCPDCHDSLTQQRQHQSQPDESRQQPTQTQTQTSDSHP